MRIPIFAVITLTALFFTSCSYEKFDESIVNDIDIEKASTLKRLETSEEDIRLFVSKISDITSEPSRARTNQMSARSDKRIKSNQSDSVLLGGEIKDIIPIKTENGSIAYWIVNFINSNGYIFLSSNKTQFPIIGFSEKGNYKVTNQKVINDEINQPAVLNLNDTIDNNNYNLWMEMLNCGNDESFEIEIITENLNQKNYSTKKSSVSPPIADRDNPLNRQSMYELGQGVQWDTESPYNYEIDMQYNVPPTVVSLAHYMYIEWYPNRYGWMYMPKSLSKENPKKTLISSLLKDITNDIGTTYDTYVRKKAYVAADRLESIPHMLQQKYDFSYGGDIVPYINDEESFQKVHKELLNYHPVLFFYRDKSINHYNGSLANRSLHTWVVDGYREIKVKYTKKKKVLGITVSTKTWYLYKDFFHMIGANKDITGWFDQIVVPYSGDIKRDNQQEQLEYGEKYVLLNIRKQ